MLFILFKTHYKPSSNISQVGDGGISAGLIYPLPCTCCGGICRNVERLPSYRMQVQIMCNRTQTSQIKFEILNQHSPSLT